MSFYTHVVVVAYKLILMNEELANRERDDSLKIRLTSSVGPNEYVHGIVEHKRGALAIASHVLNYKAFYFHLRSFEVYCRGHIVPLRDARLGRRLQTQSAEKTEKEYTSDRVKFTRLLIVGRERRL
jgi:hypothetical protein